METKREELIKRIEEALILKVDYNLMNEISGKIVAILNDYEVTSRSTEIVASENLNEKVIRRYSACMMVDGKSERTISQYIREIRKFVDFINLPFTEVGAYEIRYYLACAKERGVSNRTTENMRSYIATFFAWLVTDGVIANNPCATIKPIKYADEIRKPFSEVELDTLRSACKSDKERAILEFLLASGVRVAELAGMKVEDVDFQSLAVHVRNGKGAKERMTYITPLAALHVQKYLAKRKQKSAALFCSKNGDLTDKGIQYIMRELGKRSGIKDVHPHRCRRTFATGLVNRGMDIQEVSKLLGHTNIQTTLTYVYSDPQKINDSYRKYAI